MKYLTLYESFLSDAYALVKGEKQHRAEAKRLKAEIVTQIVKYQDYIAQFFRRHSQPKNTELTTIWNTVDSKDLETWGRTKDSPLYGLVLPLHYAYEIGGKKGELEYIHGVAPGKGMERISVRFQTGEDSGLWGLELPELAAVYQALQEVYPELTEGDEMGFYVKEAALYENYSETIQTRTQEIQALEAQVEKLRSAQEAYEVEMQRKIIDLVASQGEGETKHIPLAYTYPHSKTIEITIEGLRRETESVFSHNNRFLVVEYTNVTTGEGNHWTEGLHRLSTKDLGHLLDALDAKFPGYFEGAEMGFFLGESLAMQVWSFQDEIGTHQQQIKTLETQIEKIRTESLVTINKAFLTFAAKPTPVPEEEIEDENEWDDSWHIEEYPHRLPLDYAPDHDDYLLGLFATTLREDVYLMYRHVYRGKTKTYNKAISEFTAYTAAQVADALAQKYKPADYEGAEMGFY